MTEHLDQESWRERMLGEDNFEIIDVRTLLEFEEGYIPNAVNIDIYGGAAFLDSISALDREKTYFVYCKAGGRSAQACDIMSSLGFVKTFNLLGGFSEWNGETSK